MTGKSARPYYHNRRNVKPAHAIINEYIYYFRDKNIGTSSPYFELYREGWLTDGGPDWSQGRGQPTIAKGNFTELVVEPNLYYIFISKSKLEEIQKPPVLDRSCCQNVKVLTIEEKEILTGSRSQPQYVPVIETNDVKKSSTMLGEKDKALPYDASQNPHETLSLVKLFNPTRTGGKLTLSLNKNVERISLHYKEGWDDSNFITRCIINGGFTAGTEKQNTDILEYTIPENQRGWYHICVRHKKDVLLSNTLVFEAAAMDDDNTPIIPWNFWEYPFKPSALGRKAWDTDGPCEKFDAHFGTDSKDWEEDNHKSDKCGDGDGHCDDVSIASIIFKRPESFGALQSGDLEYAAGEYCRRWVQTKPSVWTMIGSDVVPQEKNTPDPQDDSDKKVHDFHEELLSVFWKRKEAALMDLRDFRGTAPSAKNNHAVYRVVMTFSQYSKAVDPVERDIMVSTVLYGNFDGTAETGFPDTGQRRRTTNNYRILFDEYGKASIDNRNDWIDTIQEEPEKDSNGNTIQGNRLYTPRYIHTFELFRPTPFPESWTKGINRTGNPNMTYKRLTSVSINLRPKYNKSAYGEPDDSKK